MAEGLTTPVIHTGAALADGAGLNAGLRLSQRIGDATKQSLTSALQLPKAVSPLRNQGADNSWRGTMGSVIDRECLKLGNSLSRYVDGAIQRLDFRCGVTHKSARSRTAATMASTRLVELTGFRTTARTPI